MLSALADDGVASTRAALQACTVQRALQTLRRAASEARRGRLHEEHGGDAATPQRADAAARQGALELLRYAGDAAVGLDDGDWAEAWPLMVGALGDDSDAVREAALAAAQTVLHRYALRTECVRTVLLPPLTVATTDAQWRVRAGGCGRRPQHRPLGGALGCAVGHRRSQRIVGACAAPATRPHGGRARDRPRGVPIAGAACGAGAAGDAAAPGARGGVRTATAVVVVVVSGRGGRWCCGCGRRRRRRRTAASGGGGIGGCGRQNGRRGTAANRAAAGERAGERRGCALGAQTSGGGRRAGTSGPGDATRGAAGVCRGVVGAGHAAVSARC
eukprot:ctg_2828.g391